METRDCTAGDGNKQEREQVTTPDRACTVNKLGQRRHGQCRAHDQDPYRQTNNGANFQEGRKVITRCQQQPYRQHGSDKTVAHQHPCQLYAGKVKIRSPGRTFRHPAAGNNGEYQEDQTDDRHFTNATWAQITQVNPHKNRQRDCERHGIGSPRTVGQRFHDDHRQYRKDNHHDHKTGHQRNNACRWAHLFFNQFAKGTTIATGRYKQYHEVLHRTRQHHPGQQPDHTWQIAHLRRQYRSN